jgi:nicotinamide-nucleotide amidase
MPVCDRLADGKLIPTLRHAVLQAPSVQSEEEFIAPDIVPMVKFGKERKMPDLTSLASSVASLLKAANQTIAVAESSGGGLISSALVSIPGASAYYIGGGVIYTSTARKALLRVGDEAMAGMRASTEPYALLKARTVRQQLGATWGLSETGASGPAGNRYGDAAGHACIAVTGPVERVITVETGKGDREANMWTFTKAALDLLEACLKEGHQK